MKRSLSFLALLALVAAGCDTVTESGVTLAPRSVTFEYTVGNVACGQATCSVQSDSAASLVGNLDGFQIGEIVGATVTAVTIERLSPVTASLGDLLAEAEVRVGSAEAASGTIPASVPREVGLSPAGGDVGRQVGVQSFRSALAYTPRSGARGSARFKATVTLSIEVEGL